MFRNFPGCYLTHSLCMSFDIFTRTRKSDFFGYLLVIYRKRPLIGPGPINLRKGFWKSLQLKGLISEGPYDRNRKSASKQAIAVLIKIRFAFTGFDLASKRHNKSNKSNQLSISIHLEGAYNQMNFFCLQVNGHITGCRGGGEGCISGS